MHGLVIQWNGSLHRDIIILRYIHRFDEILSARFQDLNRHGFKPADFVFRKCLQRLFADDHTAVSLDWRGNLKIIRIPLSALRIKLHREIDDTRNPYIAPAFLANTVFKNIIFRCWENIFIAIGTRMRQTVKHNEFSFQKCRMLENKI